MRWHAAKKMIKCSSPTLACAATIIP